MNLKYGKKKTLLKHFEILKVPIMFSCERDRDHKLVAFGSMQLNILLAC